MKQSTLLLEGNSRPLSRASGAHIPEPGRDSTCALIRHTDLICAPGSWGPRSHAYPLATVTSHPQEASGSFSREQSPSARAVRKSLLREALGGPRITAYPGIQISGGCRGRTTDACGSPRPGSLSVTLLVGRCSYFRTFDSHECECQRFIATKGQRMAGHSLLYVVVVRGVANICRLTARAG